MCPASAIWGAWRRRGASARPANVAAWPTCLGRLLNNVHSLDLKTLGKTLLQRGAFATSGTCSSRAGGAPLRRIYPATLPTETSRHPGARRRSPERPEGRPGGGRCAARFQRSEGHRGLTEPAPPEREAKREGSTDRTNVRRLAEHRQRPARGRPAPRGEPFEPRPAPGFGGGGAPRRGLLTGGKFSALHVKRSGRLTGAGGCAWRFAGPWPGSPFRVAAPASGRAPHAAAAKTAHRRARRPQPDR